MGKQMGKQKQKNRLNCLKRFQWFADLIRWADAAYLVTSASNWSNCWVSCWIVALMLAICFSWFCRWSCPISVDAYFSPSPLNSQSTLILNAFSIFAAKLSDKPRLLVHIKLIVSLLTPNASANLPCVISNSEMMLFTRSACAA